jgi:hypothetical protein
MTTTEKCVFCGKLKETPDNSTKEGVAALFKTVNVAWQSDMAIILPAPFMPVSYDSDGERTSYWYASVCPNCRKHSIQELYEKSVSERLEKAKEFLSDTPLTVAPSSTKPPEEK